MRETFWGRFNKLGRYLAGGGEVDEEGKGKCESEGESELQRDLTSSNTSFE